jgi:hypothetical protein
MCASQGTRALQVQVRSLLDLNLKTAPIEFLPHVLMMDLKMKMVTISASFPYWSLIHSVYFAAVKLSHATAWDGRRPRLGRRPHGRGHQVLQPRRPDVSRRIGLGGG